MTSLSTRFFGHPRLMNPAFGMKGGPATAGQEDYSSMAWSLPPRSASASCNSLTRKLRCLNAMILVAPGSRQPFLRQDEQDAGAISASAEERLNARLNLGEQRSGPPRV